MKRIPDNEMIKTNFRKELDKKYHKADSVERIRKWLIAEDKKRRDTLKKPLYEYYIKEGTYRYQPLHIRKGKAELTMNSCGGKSTWILTLTPGKSIFH